MIRGSNLSRPVAAASNLSLQSSIEALDIPGVRIGYRLISATDDRALLPDEARALASSVDKRRQASGAARMAARDLLAKLGHVQPVLPRGPSGAPVWPDGIVGSLAHDSRVAVAAVGRLRDVAALGIDVEPAGRLDADLVDIVLSPTERRRIGEDPFGGMLSFIAKEAVYKAVHPLDGEFLDHHDVAVDVKNLRAAVRNGRMLDLRFAISTHLVAVAFVPAFR